MAVSDPIYKEIAQQKFIYSLCGLFLGFTCVIGGIILFLNGIGGTTDWTANIFGNESTVTDAEAGSVLFIVGLFFAIVTRFKIKLKEPDGTSIQARAPIFEDQYIGLRKSIADELEVKGNHGDRFPVSKYALFVGDFSHFNIDFDRIIQKARRLEVIGHDGSPFVFISQMIINDRAINPALHRISENHQNPQPHIRLYICSGCPQELVEALWKRAVLFQPRDSIRRDLL